jgi:hypothetical protein
MVAYLHLVERLLTVAAVVVTTVTVDLLFNQGAQVVLVEALVLLEELEQQINLLE